MPFGPYKNFAACVADQKKKGKSDEAARKICGALQSRLEGKSITETDKIHTKLFETLLKGFIDGQSR